MLLIHPPATIPIVQLSVLSSESPAAHFALGRALSALRDSNVAILGSGFASFHNLRLMFSGATHDPAFRARSDDWNKAVLEAVTERDVQKRGERMEGWRG